MPMTEAMAALLEEEAQACLQENAIFDYEKTGNIRSFGLISTDCTKFEPHEA